MAQGIQAAGVLRISKQASRRARTCLETLVQREPNYADGMGNAIAVFALLNVNTALASIPLKSDDLDKRAYLAGLSRRRRAGRSNWLRKTLVHERTLANASYYAGCERDQLRVEAERTIALNPNDAGRFGLLGNMFGFLWVLGRRCAID